MEEFENMERHNPFEGVENSRLSIPADDPSATAQDDQGRQQMQDTIHHCHAAVLVAFDEKGNRIAMTIGNGATIPQMLTLYQSAEQYAVESAMEMVAREVLPNVVKDMPPDVLEALRDALAESEAADDAE